MSFKAPERAATMMRLEDYDRRSRSPAQFAGLFAFPAADSPAPDEMPVPFTRSPVHPFTRSPVHPFTRSPVHPFTRSPHPSRSATAQASSGTMISWWPVREKPRPPPERVGRSTTFIRGR
jgi:hypothetical protein